jgi:hypothetical protein
MTPHRPSPRLASAITPAKAGRMLAVSVAVVAIAFAETSSFAQTSEDTERSLHDAQNPIATTISVPFQSNTYFSDGPLEKTAHVLVMQPVIPIKLTQKWNLISRWVTRVVYQPRASPEQGSEFGLGNLQPEFYFSPAHAGKVTWGVGPRLYLPTATHREFGINRLGGGPTAAAVAISGPWVMGILATNVWAGSGRDRHNQMTLSPFVDYNLKDGWYVVSSPVITSNWAATSSDRWTVPVGGGIGRRFKIDNQLVNTRIQALYNVARPDLAPRCQLQVQVQLLFLNRQLQ